MSRHVFHIIRVIRLRVLLLWLFKEMDYSLSRLDDYASRTMESSTYIYLGLILLSVQM